MSRTTRFTTSIIAVLLAGLAASCTNTSSGEPRPAGSALTTTDEKSEEASSAQPARPQELQLDDIDPCALLPQADYQSYYLDEPGKRGQNDRGAADCVWFGEIGYMGITLVTYEGIEAQEGRWGEMEPTDPIDDFPAYEVVNPGDDKACFVLVDVAEGQYLDVQVGLDAFPEEIPPVCEYAHQFASSVMSTLVAS